ncbi:MAG: glutathione S-transferase N-terminal domain-containing protein [Kangiellaceae bacterium]|nr:glutathione S-transferase N-terminal domain-containing protein [Kangiellaceae bacterium]
MLQLYTDATPNGLKVSIALEEMGLEYNAQQIYLGGEQFTDEFTELNPNNKIPVLVDDGVVMTESGAILMYLAEKTKRFISDNFIERSKTVELLMFQMASLGPMFGQFLVFAAAWDNKFPEVTQRYFKEVSRILSVLNTRLANQDYLAGEQYSIADIACIPWIRLCSIHPAAESFGLNNYANLNNWWKQVSVRPAVIKGLSVPEPFPLDKQFEGFVSATIGLGGN